MFSNTRYRGGGNEPGTVAAVSIPTERQLISAFLGSIPYAMDAYLSCLRVF